ncbi:elongator complex protein 4 [Kwoniella heveanensis BCC8398]|uniref:Elongator complex protein 4 n=1 Tax=Kwoniella heveanensis BCC8398 TaxID=1296120 RepID=A0A1B9GZ60_9TREE|nr:elongator complex protein 4 [Kwoniella heveanensis BCC8398]
MPSFTRRVPSTTLPPPQGTHPSPSLSSLHLLPTGLPSLDDLLGGGLPLGSILCVLAPDSQSAWGRLIERYWIAQGLISGQSSVFVGGQEDEELGREVVAGCMWVEKGRGDGDESQSEGELDGGAAQGEVSEAKKIAWRYEKMEKFKTTVGGNGSNLSLLNTIPPSVLSSVHSTSQQSYIPLTTASDASDQYQSAGPSARYDNALRGIYEKVSKADQKRAMRITVHELGSYDWGDEVSEQHIHRFIHSLRSIIRNKSASAIITIPPHLISGSGSSKERFIQRLAWGVDACVELKGFADDPTLPPLFPTTHGLLTLHSYPTSHTLLPSTLKHSTLLGVSQESGSGGAGENNLGFRLKRKRFVVETVHLGVEGGVGERQSAPADIGGALAGTSGASTSTGIVGGVEKPKGGPSTDTTAATTTSGDTSDAIRVGGGGASFERPQGPAGDMKKKSSKPRARVRFGGEEEMVVNVVSVEKDKGYERSKVEGHDHEHGHVHGHDQKRGATSGQAGQTPAPRVALRHDRPDLYEF